MGPAAPVIMAVGAIVGAGAAVKGIQESRKQGRAQAEQGAQARASNAAEAARQRRSAMRQARAARAALESSGVATGTTGSSVDIAGAGQQSGMVADNASKLSGQLLSISNSSAQNQIIAASQRRQATFASIGSFASQAGGFASGTAGGKEFMKSIG